MRYILSSLLLLIHACGGFSIYSLQQRKWQNTRLSAAASVYRDNQFLQKPEDTIRAVGIGAVAENIIKGVAEVFTTEVDDESNAKPIVMALQKIRKDMKILDEAAGNTAQLTSSEILLLGFTVTMSGISPLLFSTKVVELLVPSMAALSAAVGIAAEYNGKVAVSTGKEIAAAAMQAAAEAEGILAGAERVKSVLPLSVGVATSASAFSLLAPSLAVELNSKYDVSVPIELYFIMPLVAVLAAAVSALATAESNSLAVKATGVGNRRFASKSTVGNTWMSTTEQLQSQSKRSTTRWYDFAVSVLPAPIIGAFFPGAISFKAIVISTFAAAQAAYYLCVAEYTLANAVDAVAVKARAAAVADTYANQGARAGSILPFTSALAGLCAAASAAVTELLPFMYFLPAQSFVATIFPSGAALFAAAASISKARCEVDASAAAEAASSGLIGLHKDDKKDDPLINLKELIQKTISLTWFRIKRRFNKVRRKLLGGNSNNGDNNDLKKITTTTTA